MGDEGSEVYRAALRERERNSTLAGPASTSSASGAGRHQGAQVQLAQPAADGVAARPTNPFTRQMSAQIPGQSDDFLRHYAAQWPNGAPPQLSQDGRAVPDLQSYHNINVEWDQDTFERAVRASRYFSNLPTGYDMAAVSFSNQHTQSVIPEAGVTMRQNPQHQHLHQPTGNVQMPNGMLRSSPDASVRMLERHRQGPAGNPVPMVPTPRQHYSYGHGQPNLLATPQLQLNQDQVDTGPDHNAIDATQIRLSVASQPSHGHPPPSYLPQNYHPVQQNGHYGAPAPAEVNALGDNPLFIGSPTGYGRAHAQSQAQLGAYGGLSFEHFETSSLTGVGAAYNPIHKSASGSPEDHSGVSSEGGGQGEDDNLDTPMTSSSSSAASADATATATATTAPVPPQNPPAKTNTRTDQNNVVGRVNSASNYGADIRGRPTLQARPPLGIDTTADEILAYYPNALHHPEVVMRLTKAGWTKRDLAKAQLYATGNLTTTAKLKTNEDRIQKQISEGGKAYFTLGRHGTKWSKKEYLDGYPMFDDLTANGWNFRHFHDKSFPNLSYEDVPLASISAFVVNKPQGTSRGLLSWMLEYAEANPWEELTTADFPKLMRVHNLQVPARLNSDHDKQALKNMRAMFEDEDNKE